jgi:hypothetical protein
MTAVRVFDRVPFEADVAPAQALATRPCETCGAPALLRRNRPSRWCSRKCWTAAVNAVPIAARFFGHVDKDGPVHPVLGSPCWLWTAYRDPAGYGVFGVKRSRTARAHRVAWEIANGPIPEGEGHHGVCVCHRCDVRACVNPAHLFLGTQADNNADRHTKGHTRGGRAPGERNSQAKLREHVARSILWLRSVGMSNVDAARAVGTTPSTVSNIVRGCTWAHLSRAVEGQTYG